MKTTTRTLLAAAIVCATAVPCMSAAALIDRGNGLVYDTDRDLTWLANANAGAGSSFDDGNITTDGLMTWTAAMNWAGSLTYAGFSDWRLPSTAESSGTISCPTLSCSSPEMGHLFYMELGGSSGSSIGAVHNADYALFPNLQSAIYWSSTAGPSNGYAYLFNFDNGHYGFQTINFEHYAWAVHNGDIGVSAVPVPTSAWLFASGLVGLVSLRGK